MATRPPRPARINSTSNIQPQTSQPSPQRGRFAVPQRGGPPPRGSGSRRGPRGGGGITSSPQRKPPAVPTSKAPLKTPPPQVPTRANRGINRRERSISIIMHESEEEEEEDDEEESSTEHSEENQQSTSDTEIKPTKAMVQREACLARSIICLDQNLFMKQIKAEEEMERRMSMVRKMPLPTVPQVPQAQPSPSPRVAPQPSPRSSTKSLKPLRLHSQRCTENIESFIQQVNINIVFKTCQKFFLGKKAMNYSEHIFIKNNLCFNNIFTLN